MQYCIKSEISQLCHCESLYPFLLTTDLFLLSSFVTMHHSKNTVRPSCFVPMHYPLQFPYNNASNQFCDVNFFHFLCFPDFFSPEFNAVPREVKAVSGAAGRHFSSSAWILSFTFLVSLFSLLAEIDHISSVVNFLTPPLFQ